MKLNAKKPIQVDTEITISNKHHDDLVKHLVEKLDDAKIVTDAQKTKFESIDKKVYGYLVLDDADAKRELDTQKGYGVKPTDGILPLTQVQIDDATTFLIEVLGVDNDLYGAIAPKEKQPIAVAFSSLMNEHASYFSHIIQLNKFLLDAFKYNFGGLIPEWETVYGNKVVDGIGLGVSTEHGVVYEGNKLTAIDPYNTYLDPSVEPTSIHSEGEFFAYAELKSVFKIKKMAANKAIFGIDRFINSGAFSVRYYNEKPQIRSDVYATQNKSWIGMLSAEAGNTTKKAVELVPMYIWLSPKEWGLGKEETQKIYRVILADSKYIVRVQEMKNAHGLLPLGITMPWQDGFQENTKSFAELLNPLQTFASAQMNIHKKSSRKALYGTTFFNKNVLNLDENYDPVASKVPVNASPDTDIRKAILQTFDAPGTENTLRDIDAVTDLMQQILPTDILKQVAGLERATQYQAASTVQGGNRRNLKIAKIINGQAFSPVKQMQMHNILQYQKQVEILTPDGELIEADVKEFRGTKMEFAISEGLRGIDKLSMIINIKEVLNSILQSQQANQQINVVEVINYWTSMLGDKTDFSQFKFKSEIDKLNPQQKQLAFQLLQQFMEQQEGGAVPSEGVTQ